tara:strand:- start:1124 stop:1414 length:291 start_codon:yes stop_codon:yes gene_type:complete
MLSVIQTGQNGTGQTSTLSGMTTVRLKSKSVTSVKNTTLKITGNQTGTTWTINVVIKPAAGGVDPLEYYPPVVNINPPPPNTPTANFSYAVDSEGV